MQFVLQLKFLFVLEILILINESFVIFSDFFVIILKSKIILSIITQ